jgi:hypothetical protein
MRSLNSAIGTVSSDLVCWTQRISAKRYSATLDWFPLSQTQFTVRVGGWWDWNTFSMSVKSNIRWSCQSKRIACAFPWITFPLPRLAWPFSREPSLVPVVPMHIMVVIDAVASVFASSEISRRSELAIWSWMRLLNGIFVSGAGKI